MHFDSTILRVIQIVDHDWSGTEKLDNLDHLLVGGETNTNMGVVFVRDLTHLLLEFEQQTVGVHELVHFRQIAGIVVVIQVGETDNCLLDADNLVVLGDLGQRIVVWLVREKELGVLVGGVVGQSVSVHAGVAKLLSVLIARLDDLTADLSHLIERRQVRKLRIVVKIE